MKVAVSASGKDLASKLDPRFGRCRYYLFIETDDMTTESIENPNAAMGGGAGIQAAQFIAAKGAQAVITGRCGPNAFDTLNAAGIKLYAGQQGRIQNVIEKLNQGQMNPVTEANASSHAGTGGIGMGKGRGMGGGKGMGGGRGMSRGRGTGDNRQ